LSRRPLLKADQWSALVDMPTDEENLIRYCTLGRAEMDLIQAKRTPHNRLGLAIQLCFLRHLGRVYGAVQI
jgi:TnpA family transposase